MPRANGLLLLGIGRAADGAEQHHSCNPAARQWRTSRAGLSNLDAGLQDGRADAEHRVSPTYTTMSPPAAVLRHVRVQRPSFYNLTMMLVILHERLCWLKHPDV